MLDWRNGCVGAPTVQTARLHFDDGAGSVGVTIGVVVLATPTARGYLPEGGSMALTPKQRKHLEARLLEERKRVADGLARYNRATRDTVQQEPGDRGTDTADEEEGVVNAARETAELAEIDAALERLYKRPEEYGRCERTGKPIPFKRLDLVPWARTCD